MNLMLYHDCIIIIIVLVLVVVIIVIVIVIALSLSLSLSMSLSLSLSFLLSLSHRGLPGDLLFLVRFRRRRRLRRHHRLRRRRSANTLQLSGKTCEANFFKPHTVDLWVWGNFLAPISVTLGQGH